MTAMLEVRDLEVAYGKIVAVKKISFSVEQGQVVSLIGTNGAGKTTTLRTISGLLRPTSGEILFQGERIEQVAAHDIVSRGLAHSPEGRRIFPRLSVEENLLLGAHCGRSGPWNLKRVYELFPRLYELRKLPSTYLSGGQQQMAAVGRALMSNPRLLLCDELSLGLAPVVIRDIYACLGAITAEGTTVILVEQDINRALDASARFYCFQEGRLALSAPTQNFDRTAITAAYFGL